MPLDLRENLFEAGLALALAGGASLVAARMGMLDRCGSLAATLLGFLILFAGGWPWAVLLLAFFATSSLLSHAFKVPKTGLAADFAKGGRRDWAQVAANGGMGLASLVLIGVGWLDSAEGWLLYAGALATVNADTWATELGVLSRRAPRLVTTWRRVPPGTSGGVTWLGSLAALAGASLIAALAWALEPAYTSLGAIGLLALSGLVGAFVDSLLGATVQAIYYCPSCAKQTERYPLHSCGTATHYARGWRWLDNDWVNFISAAAGGLLALRLTSLLGAVA